MKTEILMRIALIVAAYLAYAFVIAETPDQQAGAVAAGDDEARAASGLRLWRQASCQSCHSILGLGGHSGPDLTNVYSRSGRPMIELTISEGRPNMPAYSLTREQRRDIATYLRLVDASADFPPASLQGPVFGGR